VLITEEHQNANMER